MTFQFEKTYNNALSIAKGKGHVSVDFMLAMMELKTGSEKAFEMFEKCEPTMGSRYAIASCLYHGSCGAKQDFTRAEKVLRFNNYDVLQAPIPILYGLILDKCGAKKKAVPYFVIASRKGECTGDWNIAIDLGDSKHKLYMFLRAYSKGRKYVGEIGRLYRVVPEVKNTALAVKYLLESGNSLHKRVAADILSSLNSSNYAEFLKDASVDPTHGWKFDDTDEIYHEILEQIEKECGPADEHIRRQEADDKLAAEAAEAAEKATAEQAAKQAAKEAAEQAASATQIIQPDTESTDNNIQDIQELIKNKLSGVTAEEIMRIFEKIDAGK